MGVPVPSQLSPSWHNPTRMLLPPQGQQKPLCRATGGTDITEGSPPPPQGHINR
jgi:hypothetical protein